MDGPSVPPGEIYCAHEAPNGELGFYLVSTGGGTPYKVHVRSPSFVHMIFGTIDLGAIVRRQSGTVLGVLPAWGIVYQPLGALLFLTAAVAENKRIPFDLPEAESELIAGYYTEYTSMKMGLFMAAARRRQ